MHPRQTWEEIRDDEAATTEVFIEYVLPMAAIPALAHLLGFWYHGFFDTVFKAILWYALAVTGVWFLGKAIYYLASNFDAVPSETRSFQLAAYSFTPFFLAGSFYILPFLSIFVFFSGMYGVYILSLGLPVLMEAPDEKSTSYSLVAGAAMLVIVVAIGHLTGGVFWPSRP